MLHSSPGTDVGYNEFPPMEEVLAQDLQLCLINSDTNECNQNLSTYLKQVVDIIEMKSNESNYHQLSIYAMKLITLNLFIKNYQLCIGKILGLLTVFTNIRSYEVQTGEVCSSESDKIMKEFLCIVMFLLLKLRNTHEEEDDNDPELQTFNHCIDDRELFSTLKNYKFVTIVANFIVSHIQHTNTRFILLKFSCDIIFEYLYHVELLSDAEFDNLVSRTQLIAILIKDLLLNNSFHDYDINDSEWQNEEKLIAYEEFKLLLLINEQYLMKSYSCPEVRNKVFDSLMGENLDESTESVNSRISGFMNLLVFHINREESQIIKILILKFLYLVFTSSYTSKLYYLNDLKILVDIFVRELNDIEYMDDLHTENRILVITYLKVMYPMMMFSQLCDLNDVYKKDDIINMLSHIILNISATFNSSERTGITSKYQLQQISDLAQRCLSVPWLKKKKTRKSNSSSSSSSSSLNSYSAANPPRPVLDDRSSSNDSIANSFTRVASVRASNRNDYHLHTTKHNAEHNELHEEDEEEEDVDFPLENNHNIFLSNFNNLNMNGGGADKPNGGYQRRQSNILDLPHEYLEKDINSIEQANSQPKQTNKIPRQTDTALNKKSSKKKAPPPPPPSPYNRTPVAPLLQRTANSLSPPPYSSPVVQRSALTLEPASPLSYKSGPPPPPPRRRR